MKANLRPYQRMATSPYRCKPEPMAQIAFADTRRVIAEDLSHSSTEERYYCFGEVGGGILTVRFTCRDGVIRIYGVSGNWKIVDRSL